MKDDNSIPRAVKTDTQPTPLQHTLRLLYPFWIDAGNLDRPVRALSVQHHTGNKTELKTWQEARRVPELYREDILPLVAQVLFGIRNGTHRYLNVDRETLSHWFPADGIVGGQPNGPAFPLVPAGEGIELFLSPHGAGMLSLSFTCTRLDDLSSLQACNYHLSQLREQTAYRFRLPHDAENPNPAPEASAPFAQRLGNAGGAILLKELVDFLLAPLNAYGLQETQPQFSVYSVTRFDQHTFFDDPACHAQLKPFLAALAHVEASGQSGNLELHERILSPRHWAAVGSQGAAHLLADSDEPRTLYSAFVPYLCACLQRLTLQHLLWETDQAVQETDSSLHERQEQSRKLHQGMLRFSVQGCFSEISGRETHNQYYELALAGLRVPTTLSLVQRVLHDMEAATTAEFQQQAAQDAQVLAYEGANHAGLMTALKKTVEWLEVLFIAYFATVLAHYVGEGFSEEYAQCSVIAAPFISGLIALLCIKPYKSHPDEKTIQPPTKPVSAVLVVMSLLFVAWAAVGSQYFPVEMNGEAPDFICQSEKDCIPKNTGGTI